ncbi:MAG: hypothetical protein ACJAV7_001488 [Flavobacteriales bacterium]
MHREVVYRDCISNFVNSALLHDEMTSIQI